jgi:hypothetical protein
MKLFDRQNGLCWNRLLGWGYLVACWLVWFRFRQFDWDGPSQFIRAMIGIN